MDDDQARPGRTEAVIGAMFCAVAALRLTCDLAGIPCPEAWQWTACLAGASAMILSMAWRNTHPRAKKTTSAGA